jgi:hypothetical protein
MAIKIVDEQPDIQLTSDEHMRLLSEYRKAFMSYAGTPPTFESWVRSRVVTESKLLNEFSV